MRQSNSKLVILKVLNQFGGTDESTLLKSINWIIENKNKYNIKIVNISIGVSIKQDGREANKDPILQQLTVLKKMGTLIISSAGNNGPFEDSMLYPSQSDSVLTVGYINNNRTYTLNDDHVAIQSSRGPSANSPCKPDLVTFGVDIKSLDYKDKHDYTLASGSSYATAIVSGVAAILIDKYPKYSSEDIEHILKNSVFPLKEEDKCGQGLGELHFKK